MSATIVPVPHLFGVMILVTSSGPAAALPPATTLVTYRDGRTQAAYRDGRTQTTYRDGTTQIGGR